MRKSILLHFLILYSGVLFSQNLGYTDLGVLFSQENFNGSARYNALSGAFGALGGEMSSLYHNPAGGAVFAKSEMALAYSHATIKNDATYYGSTTYNNNTSTRFPHVGLVFVFDIPYNDSNWKKFSLGFNYSMLNDFNNRYKVSGNNGTFARYTLHPNDGSETPFNIPVEQYFENNISGFSEVYNISFSSAYKDYIYIGGNLNFHSIEFVQENYLFEKNKDDNDYFVEADYNQYLTTKTDGISLGAGMIIKPFKNFRLGFAYQSPVWYFEAREESNAIDYDPNNVYTGFQEQGYLDMFSNDVPEDYYNTGNYPDILTYKYGFNSPEKWTASAAITLGQHGLISVDYTEKNYKLLRFNNSTDFANENLEIQNILTTARGLRAGAELRFNQISLRGGAQVEESPYKADHSSDEFYKIGFSAGAGFRFDHAKLDFSYQHFEMRDQYSMYHPSENVNNINLLRTDSRITTTLTIIF